MFFISLFFILSVLNSKSTIAPFGVIFLPVSSCIFCCNGTGILLIITSVFGGSGIGNSDKLTLILPSSGMSCLIISGINIGRDCIIGAGLIRV